MGELEYAGAMKQLGFTEPEARVYLALLDEPEGFLIEEVGARVGISPEDARSALLGLSEKGFISLDVNRVRAVSPREAFAKLQRKLEEELERRMEALRKTISSLTKELEPKYVEKRLSIRPEDILEPLESLRDMEVRTVQIISNAQRSVFILAETFGWYDKVREELFRALDRGVEVRVLLMVKNEDSEKRARELLDLGAQVRHCRGVLYPVRGTLGDESELVFLIWASPGRERPVYFRPHYTTNQGLIRVFLDAFSTRWELSEGF